MALITGAISRAINTVRTARTAAVSFAGDIPNRLINTTRTAIASVASFAGAVTSSLSPVQRFFVRSVSGLVTFSARAWRRVPLSGWLIRTISLSRTKGGVLQTTGTVITGVGQHFYRTVVGAVFLIGASLTDLAHTITKASSIAASGTISSFRSILRTRTGAVTSTATIQRALDITQSSPIYNSLYFDIADDGCLYHAESGVNTYPVTVAAWFKLTSLPVWSVSEFIIAGACNLATPANLNRFAIRLLQSGSGGPYYVISDPSTVGSDYAYIQYPLIVGEWYHVAAVFASATSRQIYLDSVAGTENTESVIVSTIDTVSIGGLYTGGAIEQNPTDGMIQEVGFWDIALTPANIASLAAGALPKDVELANLISYHRMKDFTVPDEISETPWTIVGTPDMVPYSAFADEDYSGALGLGMAGNIQKALAKTYDSALSFAGAVAASAISASYSAAGTISSAGSWLRSLASERTRAGAITFAKDLAYNVGGKFFPSIIAASVSFTSTLLAGIGVDAATVGTLQVYGRITVIDAIITRLTAASMTPAGALSYVLVGARTTLSSAISITATLSRLLAMIRLTSSAISLAGEVAYSIAGERFYSTISDLNLSATISRIIEAIRLHSGVLDFSATVSRLCDLARTKAGELTFSGTALAALVGADTRLGQLSFAGVTDRGIISGSKTEQSAVAFGGAVAAHRVYARTLSGDLTFAKSFIKVRETLYLGPPNYGV